jgi:sec-independent protein translocase protein TatA
MIGTFAMPLLLGFFNSPYDWLVIALLAFLFFGNRLPTVMRSLGEGVTEFKKGMNGGDGDDDEDSRNRKDLPRKPEGLENRVNGDSRTNGDSRKLDEVRKPEERPV